MAHSPSPAPSVSEGATYTCLDSRYTYTRVYISPATCLASYGSRVRGERVMETRVAGSCRYTGDPGTGDTSGTGTPPSHLTDI